MTKSGDYRALALEALVRAGRGQGRESCSSVASRFRVSKKTLWLWHMQQRAEGSSAPRRKRVRAEIGVPDAIFAYVREIFLLEPRLTWLEASEELLAVANVEYTSRQIKSACLARGLTRKTVTTAAKERDEVLRDAFCRVLQEANRFTQSHFVVVDESLKKGVDVMRSKGVAPKGQRPVAPTSGFLNGQRVSALVAVDYGGIVAVETIDTKEHSVTSDVFQAFLEASVLTQMQPFPNPRSVLILDNSRVHDRVKINCACASKEIIVLWLPAYSCDFSPIELVFNNAKRVLKERFGRKPNGLSLADMFSTAIYTCLTPEQMCSTFEHCLKLKVTDEERAAVV